MMKTTDIGRSSTPRSRASRTCRAWLTASLWLALTGAVWAQPSAGVPSQFGPQPVVHRVKAASERITMVALGSRVLELSQPVPQAQVNNPEVLEVTPLSPNQLQLYAKKAGVTQVNLFNDRQEVTATIEVIVYADARELTAILQSMFPKSNLRVVPLPNSVALIGNVDNPQDVNRIVSVAEQFHPQVLNFINVGGVQQVLLKVKVMEVSRTKLRNLGIDFAELSSGGSYFASAGAGLLRPATLIPSSTSIGALSTTGNQTLGIGVIDSAHNFGLFLNALRQDNLAKILAEPTLVTVSGRPAFFNSGGEIPILVPQSLGTISIQYRPYGTQVDFVPIVLGNGNLRLEIKPRVSDIDPSRTVTLNNIQVPALRVREIDTGVEMRAGQTLAIGGLVQNRVDASRRGIPFFNELPYIGPFFGQVNESVNEIELLMFVTPHLVEALDPQQVPPCGPGDETTNPTDFQFFLKNHIETPKLCPPGDLANAAVSSPTAGPGPVAFDPTTVPAGTTLAQPGLAQPGYSQPGVIGPPPSQQPRSAPQVAPLPAPAARPTPPAPTRPATSDGARDFRPSQPANLAAPAAARSFQRPAASAEANQRPAPTGPTFRPAANSETRPASTPVRLNTLPGAGAVGGREIASPTADSRYNQNSRATSTVTSNLGSGKSASLPALIGPVGYE